MVIGAGKMGGQVAVRTPLRRAQQATSPLWVSPGRFEGGGRTLGISMEWVLSPLILLSKLSSLSCPLPLSLITIQALYLLSTPRTTVRKKKTQSCLHGWHDVGLRPWRVTTSGHL